MQLQYFVTQADAEKRVLIEMEPATQSDLEATQNGW